MLSFSDMSTEPTAGKERVVSRSGNRIRFLGRVNARAHREFLYCLSDGIERGYEDFVLDFSACDRA